MASAILMARRHQTWTPQEDIDEALHEEAKAFNRLVEAVRREAIRPYEEAVREWFEACDAGRAARTGDELLAAAERADAADDRLRALLEQGRQEKAP